MFKINKIFSLFTLSCIMLFTCVASADTIADTVKTVNTSNFIKNAPIYSGGATSITQTRLLTIKAI
jgi:hypothetical protein